MGRTVRAIEWYSKKTGFMVDKEEIKNFNLEHFKRIFNHTYEDDPHIYGCCYDILEEHVPQVQPYINHPIDLKKYDYSFVTYEELSKKTHKK